MAVEPQKSKNDDSLADLKKASQTLREKIDDEKRKHDMPINPSLGNSDIDARNADGRNDLREEEDL